MILTYVKNSLFKNMVRQIHFPQYDKIFFSSIPAIDLLSDSTGTDMVMMTIKNFDFLDNEIEEYDVSTFHSSVYTGSTLSKVLQLPNGMCILADKLRQLSADTVKTKSLDTQYIAFNGLKIQTN